MVRVANLGHIAPHEVGTITQNIYINREYEITRKNTHEINFNTK